MNSADADAPSILHRRWEDRLFLHWPIAVDALLPRLPPGLGLDTFDDRAWISITPFRTTRVHAHGSPSPRLGAVHYELELRTYVEVGGVHGLWFFSVDASNALAVAAARIGSSFPTHLARMRLRRDGAASRFTSKRLALVGPSAELSVAWRPGEPLAEAELGSLEFFLVERYWHYTLRFGRLMRGQIEHPRWSLRNAEVVSLSSTLHAAAGLEEPDEPPIAHAQRGPLDVAISPLEEIPAGQEIGAPNDPAQAPAPAPEPAVRRAL